MALILCKTRHISLKRYDIGDYVFVSRWRGNALSTEPWAIGRVTFVGKDKNGAFLKVSDSDRCWNNAAKIDVEKAKRIIDLEHAWANLYSYQVYHEVSIADFETFLKSIYF